MSRGIKRSLDVVVALTGLALAAPVMAAVAVAIRATMGAPVLFRQVRPGYREEPFELVKFRTMRRERGRDGRELPAAERVTPLGWWLRRTSLDELPQLWNVLKGDLSLVGPRPLLTEYLPHYSERERLRHTVRPGITGLAQVSGRNLISWEQKLELDAQYVERWSLGLDARILAKTLLRVARSSNIARDPNQEGYLHELRGAAPARDVG
jgi:sugar transferase EpsL